VPDRCVGFIIDNILKWIQKKFFWDAQRQ
jgi:hypothetical protein